MEKVIKTINIAADFSKFPGGRFLTDGKYSGERFREEFLVPALKAHEKIEVELDGTLGYGSSFLEEAFGGLVRDHGFDSAMLLNTFVFRSKTQTTVIMIEDFIRDAGGLAEGS